LWAEFTRLISRSKRLLFNRARVRPLESLSWFQQLEIQLLYILHEINYALHVNNSQCFLSFFFLLFYLHSSFNVRFPRSECEGLGAGLGWARLG
jgi:hypothetical protein